MGIWLGPGVQVHGRWASLNKTWPNRHGAGAGGAGADAATAPGLGGSRNVVRCGRSLGGTGAASEGSAGDTEEGAVYQASAGWEGNQFFKGTHHEPPMELVILEVNVGKTGDLTMKKWWLNCSKDDLIVI